MKRYYVRDCGDSELLGVIVEKDASSAGALFHAARNARAFCGPVETFLVESRVEGERPRVEWLNGSVK